MAERERRLSENTEGHRQRWQQLLRDWPTSELNLAAPIILAADVTPQQAIETLLENNIRAAPVQDGNTWVGVFDLREAVKFAIQDYEETHDNQEQRGVFDRAMDFFARSPHISTNTLTYLSRTRSFPRISINSTVFDVTSLLAEGSHIVGVEDDSNAVVGIITQGALFRALCSKWEIHESLLPLRMLADLGLVTTPVKTIPTTMIAVDAFRQMANLNLSGLAVVDENGVLVHNTSGTDIKLWLQESSSLGATIEEFLIAIRRQQIEIRAPTCTCGLDDTLQKAVGKLEATRYHRLWVVNDARQPIGVLALTDIFRFLTSESV